jgi:hypothetical protein
MGSRNEVEVGQSGGPKNVLKTLPREPRMQPCDLNVGEDSRALRIS